jgi:hypothetical protein
VPVLDHYQVAGLLIDLREEHIFAVADFSTVRLARLGLWKVAFAISMRIPIKLRSWGATGESGVSTPTSSQVNRLSHLHRRLT